MISDKEKKNKKNPNTLFPTTFICEAVLFFIHFTQSNIKQPNAEANMRIMYSIKSDIKEICKNVKQCQSFSIDTFVF